jgi:hypothetical protein
VERKKTLRRQEAAQRDEEEKIEKAQQVKLRPILVDFVS